MKTLSALLAIALVSQPFAMAAPASTGSERGMVESAGAESQYQKLMQEATRNREMIEIWKEHVRTLTQERNEAFKRIEEMQVGPVQEYSQTSKAVQTTDSRVPELETEKEEALARIRELNAELESAKNASGEKLAQKELKEMREDREVLIRDKNKAMTRIQELEQGSTSPALEARIKKLESENNRLVSAAGAREKELQAWITQLEASPQAPSAPSAPSAKAEKAFQVLRAENDKLSLIEKESVEKTAYFVSQIEETEAKLKAAAEENASLQAAIAASEKTGARTAKLEASLAAERKARETAEVNAADGTATSEKIQKELAETREENGALSEEIRRLRARAEDLTAESLAAKATREELTRAKEQLAAAAEEKGSLEKSTSDFGDRLAALSAENEKLKIAQTENGNLAARFSETEAELATALKRAAAAEDATLAAASSRDALAVEVETLKGRTASLETGLEKARTLEAELAAAKEETASSENVKQTALRQLESLKFQAEKSQVRSSQISEELEKERAASAADKEQLAATQAALEEAMGREASLSSGREESELKIAALRERVQKLQAEGESFRQEEESRGLELAKAKQAVAEKEEELRLLRSLELDNQALKARAEKADLIEEEMNDARAYLSSVIEGLEGKIAKLVEEKENFRLSYEASTVKATELNDRVNELAEQAARAEELDAQIKASRVAIEELRSENERIRSVEGDLAKANARVQDLQTRLKANLADIQNLRENFATLVEPLAQSFEERARR